MLTRTGAEVYYVVGGSGLLVMDGEESQIQDVISTFCQDVLAVLDVQALLDRASAAAREGCPFAPRRRSARPWATRRARSAST